MASGQEASITNQKVIQAWPMVTGTGSLEDRKTGSRKISLSRQSRYSDHIHRFLSTCSLIFIHIHVRSNSVHAVVTFQWLNYNCVAYLVPTPERGRKIDEGSHQIKAMSILVAEILTFGFHIFILVPRTNTNIQTFMALVMQFGYAQCLEYECKY